MSDEIVVSTDGSALGNPNGPMGWAWADHAKHAGGAPGHDHDDHGYGAGGATNGTNQIGELCAVLEALRAHPGPQPLLIESDSQYAINCSTKWVKGWKRNGWVNSQKKPVKNRELIEAIDNEISKRPGPVRFRWVKGHAGNEGNELVDELARTFAGDCRSGARDGYLPIEGWQSLIASEYSDGLDVPPDVQLMLDGEAKATAGGAVSSTPGTRIDASGDAAAAAPEAQAGNAGKPSLAELLAEPEGVPDYGETDTAEATGKPKADVESQGAESTTENTAPHPIDESPDSAQTSATSPDISASARTTPAPQTSGAPTSTLRPSGLTVSGAVRFAPAPKTSPYYTGAPMHVHGFIEIDGLVDGDGNLTLDAARFLRP